MLFYEKLCKVTIICRHTQICSTTKGEMWYVGKLPTKCAKVSQICAIYHFGNISKMVIDAKNSEE